MQGFLTQFGKDGVSAFFDSTSGWERPIKNDRKNPIDPRAQTLNMGETQLVNHHLKQLSAVITA